MPKGIRNSFSLLTDATRYPFHNHSLTQQVSGVNWRDQGSLERLGEKRTASYVYILILHVSVDALILDLYVFLSTSSLAFLLKSLHLEVTSAQVQIRVEIQFRIRKAIRAGLRIIRVKIRVIILQILANPGEVAAKKGTPANSNPSRVWDWHAFQ